MVCAVTYFNTINNLILIILFSFSPAEIQQACPRISETTFYNKNSRYRKASRLKQDQMAFLMRYTIRIYSLFKYTYHNPADKDKQFADI